MPIAATAALLLAAAPPAATPATFAEHQAQCGGKEGWSDPAPPVRIFANVYDIGSCGITVLLVAGDRGHIVIDGATAEAAPAIAANITRLGYRLRDVKLLLASHEHFDHVGGLHELQRLTGARMIATPGQRATLRTGRPVAEDPQAKGLTPIAPVRIGRVVRDRETVRLGHLALTPRETPGHAPGSTSWSWQSCEGLVCRRIVYADSLSAVSDDGYRFTDHPAYVARLRASLLKVAAMRCDILITPHPSASNLYPRLAGKAPLVDAAGCADYASASRNRLDKRRADEAAGR